MNIEEKLHLTLVGKLNKLKRHVLYLSNDANLQEPSEELSIDRWEGARPYFKRIMEDYADAGFHYKEDGQNGDVIVGGKQPNSAHNDLWRVELKLPDMVRHNNCYAYSFAFPQYYRSPNGKIETLQQFKTVEEAIYEAGYLEMTSYNSEHPIQINIEGKQYTESCIRLRFCQDIQEDANLRKVLDIFTPFV